MLYLVWNLCQFRVLVSSKNLKRLIFSMRRVLHREIGIGISFSQSLIQEVCDYRENQAEEKHSYRIKADGKDFRCILDANLKFDTACSKKRNKQERLKSRQSVRNMRMNPLLAQNILGRLLIQIFFELFTAWFSSDESLL